MTTNDDQELETIEVEDPEKVMILDDDEYSFLCSVAADMDIRYPADVLSMILQNAKEGYQR